MKLYNYCLIKKNKLYEELYEILEEDELVMDNYNHSETIKYKIKKLVTSYLNDKIKLSNGYTTNEESFENLMLEITQNTDDNLDDNLQGNTLLTYADENSMYEIVFMEDLITEKTETELNQIASISNIELAPIYGNIAIVKTCYEKGKMVSGTIYEEDIVNLIINNFYHKGVMINTDGTTKEIEFTGDNPNLIIGGNFKQTKPLQLFGLTLVGYNEQGTELNEKATKIFGDEIKGRFYITTLCPITNKRFWGLTNEILQNLLKLINYLNGNSEEKEKINKMDKELEDNKLMNPFFLIKKYCV
jgi:hypothetical protein